MKRIIILLLFLFVNFCYAQQPFFNWAKTYGGSQYDYGFTITQLINGNYIIAGATGSNDGDIHGFHGYGDIFVLCMNSNGDTLWTKAIGGSADDCAWSSIATDDGGFILGGYSTSIDGDATGNIIYGGMDFWIVKCDQNGNILWHKNYGGSQNEVICSIDKSHDGGFFLTGYTESNDHDVQGFHGVQDIWILKINQYGNIIWNRCFGGSNVDGPSCIKETLDKGCIIVGSSYSNDGDFLVNYGDYDYFILKLDSLGNKQWLKTYGGSFEDDGSSVAINSDSSYLVVGSSSSNDLFVHGNMGSYDVWAIKTDKYGDTLWTKNFGGSGLDAPVSIINTSDKGFVISGGTTSNDFNVSGYFGDLDAWVFKIDSVGLLIWQRCLGGYNYDVSYCSIETSDGYFVTTGITRSTDEYFPINKGELDIFVVQLSDLLTNISPQSNFIQQKVFPNPTESNITIQLLGNLDKNCLLYVYNSLGKKMYEHNISKGEKIININVSNFPSGIFYYTLGNYKGSFIKK